MWIQQKLLDSNADRRACMRQDYHDGVIYLHFSRVIDLPYLAKFNA
jgi:hypothetical protein